MTRYCEPESTVPIMNHSHVGPLRKVSQPPSGYRPSCSAHTLQDWRPSRKEELFASIRHQVPLDAELLADLNARIAELDSAFVHMKEIVQLLTAARAMQQGQG